MLDLKGTEMMRLDSKRIPVSPKRQVTIPKKYADQLNITHEVECFVRNGEIVIRPVRQQTDAVFADLILEDLIKQGLSGEQLLEQFRYMQSQIRPAVEQLIEEADKFASTSKGTGRDKTDELFGELEG